MGYLQNNTVMSIRNEEDLWTSLQKGVNIMLWCDGLKQSESESTSGRKPDSVGESGSEDEGKGQTKQKKKEDQVCCIIADLNKQHGEIWSKVKVAGLCDRSTFYVYVRAGGGDVGNKKSNNDTASLVLSQLTSAKPSSSRSDSPGKIIENRS